MILPVFLSSDNLSGIFSSTIYLISSNNYYNDLYVTCIPLGRLSNVYVEMNFLFFYFIRHFIKSYLVFGLRVNVSLFVSISVVMVSYLLLILIFLLFPVCDSEWFDRMDDARLLSIIFYKSALLLLLLFCRLLLERCVCTVVVVCWG